MAASKTATYDRLGDLMREYREAAPLTQTALAHLLTEHLGREVSQTAVSALEKGQRWGDNPDLWRALIDVLDVPVRLVQEAAGLPFAGDDDPEPPKPGKPKAFTDIVNSDPTLSKAAKQHLINQYGLLQLASREGLSVEPEASVGRRQRKSG